MKRIVLLLILFCSITVSAQQKQRKVVKLTTRQGVSYVGFLEELKTFEYVLLEVGEKRIQIPFDDMAYIDELKRIVAELRSMSPLYTDYLAGKKKSIIEEKYMG